MIPGYIYDTEVELLMSEAAKVPDSGVIVEIGSYVGKSTVALASAAAPKVEVYAVDTWDNRAMGKDLPRDTYEEFLENTSKYLSIRTKRGESKDVASLWTLPIDLLFIDADHSYAAVLSDLNAWMPFLKPGGTLIMHDYTENCGVRPAFEAYNPKYKILKIITSTLVVKI